MAELREFSNAADEMSTAYTHYLLRTTVASTRALHLFEQVIGCVGRRQVSPEALEESLARFAHAHAADRAANAAAANARLITGLGASAFLPTDRDDAPAAPDSANVTGSVVRLREEALERSTRAIEAYYAQVAAVATGAVTPDAFRRAAKKQTPGSIASELGRVARIWFEYLGDLDAELARAAEQYLLGVLRTANPVGFDGDVVELAGPVNSHVSAVVTLDNAREERAVIRCGVSDVRRADGVGPAFPPDLVLAPEEIVLERDREANVHLSLWLDDAKYDAGAPYVGALHILRDGAPRLDVPLRITPMVKLP